MSTQITKNMYTNDNSIQMEESTIFNNGATDAENLFLRPAKQALSSMHCDFGNR